MLLTITTTYQPATDLGYLLHKHPDRCQSFALAFGQASVYYPEAEPARCTAALQLDIDPVRLARRERDAPDTRPLEPYVNDRPYVASSFLSVALAQVYGSALAGQCKPRPELVETPLPLHARLWVVPGRSDATLLQRLFAPLGYAVQVAAHPLDTRDPDAGNSPYVTLDLQAQTRLCDLLTHLYVLIPVLDDQKHYYVGEAEVEKLLRQGEDWLAQHPERELITRRYLRHRSRLTRAALARLAEEDVPDPEAATAAQAAAEDRLEQPLRLHEQRIEAVAAVLAEHGARRVLDLGCGEGHLLQRLLADSRFVEIVGIDVSVRALERARERLHLERLTAQQRERMTLLHGSLTYRDQRLSGYDGAALVEVIEHIDPSRLPLFERAVFGEARPGIVAITTPNAEYNALFPNLSAGRFRHRDHRFEWSRAEFAAWADGVAQRYGYTATFQPIGPLDANYGAPTQMGVLRHQGEHA
jgi:3' terminal RNA ribose 2'-O-methyltransferase Hen1